MPAKFKPSAKVYKRGIPARNLPMEHFYLKQTPLDELMKYINNPSGKPKIKQKCRNEVVRRGYRIVYKEVNDG